MNEKWKQASVYLVKMLEVVEIVRTEKVGRQMENDLEGFRIRGLSHKQRREGDASLTVINIIIIIIIQTLSSPRHLTTLLYLFTKKTLLYLFTKKILLYHKHY